MSRASRVSGRFSAFNASRNSVLATPETRKTPLETDTTETWIGSQKDCSAGTTGAASA